MPYNAVITDEGYRDLNPISFGYQNCAPAHAYGPAVRMYWLIHYVVAGKGVYEIGENRYNVSAGSAFVIPPHVQSCYKADGEEPWSYIWIGFTSEGSLPVKLTDVIECPAAEPIFQSMKRCEEQESGRSAFLCGKLWTFFALLLGNENKEVDCVEQSLDYIRSEYMNGITVDQLAKRANLNRSYFSALFKKKTGLSPGKYLLDYRMHIATMLLDSGSSVSVTARSVGYADVYIFSKMFKRHYGVSPREHVRQNKK